jgi:hypothetical protein
MNHHPNMPVTGRKKLGFWRSLIQRYRDWAERIDQEMGEAVREGHDPMYDPFDPCRFP